MDLKKNTIKLILCEKCKKEFLVQQVKFKQKDVIDKKGTWLRLFWYECPFCNEIFRVKIDTRETLVMESEYQEVINRIQRHKTKGRNPTEQQTEKVLKLSRRLDLVHKRLNAKYDKSFTTLATINN